MWKITYMTGADCHLTKSLSDSTPWTDSAQGIGDTKIGIVQTRSYHVKPCSPWSRR